MYTPKYAQPKNQDDIYEFIQANGFATLISSANGLLSATHTPLLLDDSRTFLSGHISRANPQWKNFSSANEVLAIFQGPHAYISSSWYDHENVPTWNYLAAHVYGRVSVLEGDALRLSLKKLVDKYEAHSEKPVSVDAMTPSYLEREMRGIVGFQIKIERVEAAFKLSQNRDAANHTNIIHQLESRGDSRSMEVATEMKKTPNT